MKRYITVVIALLLTACSANGSGVELNTLSASEMISSTTTAAEAEVISEAELADTFNKAAKLYEAVEGMNGYWFTNRDGRFYAKENVEAEEASYEDVIAAYHDSFTEEMCKKIFGGELSVGGAPVLYGICGEKSDPLEVKSDTSGWEKYDSIVLFNVGRGADLNSKAYHYEIVSRDGETLKAKCVVDYIDIDDTIDFQLIEQDGKQIIYFCGRPEKIGCEYTPYDVLSTEEFNFTLKLEDGKLKFDSFDLWY